MKRYLLSHKVLASVMKLLTSNHNEQVDGDRCLKLAVLRCLRSVLSLKDEFYNRHIVQNNLFTPVFDAFRANPVGDNLVSSSIIEMCDFIRTENIKSVIEHIATKYLGQKQYSSSSISDSPIKRIPSLEDVATPYVDTLTLLRQKYEENKTLSNLKVGSNDTSTDNENQNRLMQNEKAREDQRKFHESSSEESYFFDDANARPPSPAPSRTNNGINI
jgi:protein phosphatase-4 regulatory subunit 3